MHRAPALLVVLVAAAAALVLLLASGGDSSDDTSPVRSGNETAGEVRCTKVRLADCTGSASEWREVSHDIARASAGLQRPDGTYRDALKLSGSRYGDSVLGYALVQTGLREDDDRLTGNGLRALSQVVAQTERQRDEPSVFEGMAVASAYNLARRRLSGDPLFRRHRGRWERYLGRVRMTKLFKEQRYGNHYLPEAIATFELERSGLTSTGPRAIVGADRERAVALALRLINVRIPQMARERGVRTLGGRAFILSDPPDDPATYQAFSLGLYARAVKLAGERASPAARRTVRAIVHASWLIAAPDGDLGYFGRSQEASWTLGMTAYGAEVAAKLHGSSAGDDRRAHALAERAVARLRDFHGVGPRGLYVTPGVRLTRMRRYPGRDAYTGVVSFTGMTLMGLNWALDLQRGQRRAGRLAADSAHSARLSKGPGTFAVAGGDGVWFVARQDRSLPRIHHPNPNDLRLDFGLIAAKHRTRRGWRDLLRIRPKTSYTKPDSAGPTLLTAAGTPAFPFGERLRVAGDGRVTIVGGYRTQAGVVVRSGVRFRIERFGCGVRQTFPIRRGDRLEYSVFFRRGDERPRLAGRRLADADQRWSFSSAPRASFEGGYASGIDPALVRARLRFTGRGSRAVRAVLCPP